MVLDILTLGHPTLRKVSEPISRDELLGDACQQFIDELIETMHHTNGAGIAAIQVGRAQRICVIEVMDNPRYPYLPALPLRVFVNPQLTAIDERTAMNYDGCLSVPGIRGEVERPLGLRVQAWDRAGNEFQASYYGLAAIIVAHECDHLDGQLFVDHVKDPNTLCTWEMFDQYYRQKEVEKWTAIQAEFPEAERIER